MLIWSIVLAGLIALLFFGMYPRSDYIRTVETPIAETPIVQFTTQHENALALALNAVEVAAKRTDADYITTGNTTVSRTSDIGIHYPDFDNDTVKKKYLPQNLLKQIDWGEGALISSAVICLNEQGDLQENCTLNTRDYLITYAQNPGHLEEWFPAWGSAWEKGTKNIDTCGIIRNNNIQSPKCDNEHNICTLTSANLPTFTNLVAAIKDTDVDVFPNLEKLKRLISTQSNSFICMSPIDHYAYDGVSITGRNAELIAHYDGIHNTWTGHNNTTTTWTDISGNNHDSNPFSGAQFQDNHLLLTGASGSTVQLPTTMFKANQPFTAELVFNPTKSAETVFLSSNNSAINLKFGADKKLMTSTATLNDDTANIIYSFSLTAQKGTSNNATLSVNYGTDSGYNGFTHKFTQPLANINQNLYLGSALSNNNATTPLTGQYYAARFYAKPLTKKQRELNYLIDRKRFGIPDTQNTFGTNNVYLQSDGIAYFDTDITGKSGLSSDISFSAPSSSDNTLCGSRTNSNRIYLLHFFGQKYTYGYGNYVQGTSTVAYNQKTQIETILKEGEQKLYADDVLQASGTNGTNIDTGYNLYLFACNNAGNPAYHMPSGTRLYSAKIYDNNTLQRDYIPATDPFGRPSLYDKVERKFYYNAAGAGKFTLGK